MKFRPCLDNFQAPSLYGYFLKKFMIVGGLRDQAYCGAWDFHLIFTLLQVNFRLFRASVFAFVDIRRRIACGIRRFSTL